MRLVVKKRSDGLGRVGLSKEGNAKLRLEELNNEMDGGELFCKRNGIH